MNHKYTEHLIKFISKQQIVEALRNDIKDEIVVLLGS